MLEVRSLNVSYGDAPALWDISLTVGAGELVSVVGPNGAGKTTLINSIARILPSRGGSLWLNGAEVTAVPSQAMCELGVALIPEGRRLFVGMTVEENLEMGCYRPAARIHRVQGLERVYEIFPILKERKRQIAGTLSGGQQQMLAVGRALMARPKLLLVDEPSLGLSPLITEQLFEVLKKIHADGMSMLLIEQNVGIALEIAERVYVLEGGRIVSEGKPKELLATRHIREAYLGEDVGGGAR